MSDTKPEGFAAYKGARMLCSEHVSGNTMHITWQSYATKDDVATVIAHYEKAIGAKPEKGTKGEVTFSDGKNQRLSVIAADKNDALPNCGTKPTKDEKTVVLISTAAR